MLRTSDESLDLHEVVANTTALNMLEDVPKSGRSDVSIVSSDMISERSTVAAAQSIGDSYKKLRSGFGCSVTGGCCGQVVR